MAIDVQPVTSERWADLEALFERIRGPRGGKPVTAACWCMAWRLPSDAFKAGWGSGRTRGAGNKAALHAIVDGGRIPGLLAYEDGTPVGWCSVAPREEFVALESSRTLARIDDRPVWSVVCFYIDRDVQGQASARCCSKRRSTTRVPTVQPSSRGIRPSLVIAILHGLRDDVHARWI